MAFFYETFPIFLCGLAAGIVITALVGWRIKSDPQAVSKIGRKKWFGNKRRETSVPENSSFIKEERQRTKNLAWIKMRRAKPATTHEKESF